MSSSQTPAAAPVPAFVRTHRDGDVLVVEIDNPPVNALSPGVPEGLRAALDAADHDEGVRAIVIRGAGRTFVAGADISTLEDAAWGDPTAAPDWSDLLRRIEDSRAPIVMAIHGTALGGGLELAMAGHYRIADAGAQVGQPEVNLGIIPGAEGTQRLPRLAGVAKALDMCVTGRPISAADALAAGVVDEVADGDLTASAVAFARRVTGAGRHPKTRERLDRLGDAATNAPLFEAARAQAGKIRRRQIAPLKAVEAIETATRLPFEEGCKRERALFYECVQGEQAKALIHVFFAERAATKLADDVGDATPAEIRTVAIVGAGTMGSGIAMACANAGLEVLLTDATNEALAAGDANIRRNYDVTIARGRLTAESVAERRARVHLVPAAAFPARVATADLVIEAVFEDLPLKQRVFREIDAIARPGCILATNTSTLDIDAIASATSRPASVVGLHFFSPAAVMRLLEIVRGPRTGLDVLVSALAFAKKVRKQGVVVGNGPGFVGNRLMFPYMYETQFLVEEGATPAQVDRALTAFGMAMGMFAVDDLAGLDVGDRVRKALGHFSDPRERRPVVHERLVAMGRLGQKRGAGWYKYDDPRTPTPDPEVEALIRSLATDAGIAARTISDEEIVDRAILALVNEGARALEAGVAARASDIDVIYVNGYGFPGWRGGPLFYADRRGLGDVLARIRSFHREHGERWRPAPLLVELAERGATFRDGDRARRR
jgi:3-hydroxyacyl-CoA dehydrogenase